MHRRAGYGGAKKRGEVAGRREGMVKAQGKEMVKGEDCLHVGLKQGEHDELCRGHANV